MLQTLPPVPAIVRVNGDPVSAEIPSPDEVPRPWHPAAAQGVHIGGLYSDADDLPEWRAALIHGVVTINADKWTPTSSRSIPPSITNKLGMYLSARWAMLFNASPEAQKRNHWALVCCRHGNVIVLTGIQPEDRPSNPGDFPPCVIGGLAFDEADQIAISANRARCEFERVPKLWTVAVRRADSVEQDGEVSPC